MSKPWRIYTQRGSVDLGEGPFTTKASAVEFAENEVGAAWTVRQDGAKPRRSDARSKPMPKGPSVRQMVAGMARDGYVSGGNLAGGGEYRWTVTFPSAAKARGFAEAIVHQTRGPVRTSGRNVSFAVGPNHWPATLFASELATFGGEHGYGRV